MVPVNELQTLFKLLPRWENSESHPCMQTLFGSRVRNSSERNAVRLNRIHYRTLFRPMPGCDILSLTGQSVLFFGTFRSKYVSVYCQNCTEEIQALIPDRAGVVLLVDGGFDGIDLQAIVNGWKWEYVCRTAPEWMIALKHAGFLNARSNFLFATSSELTAALRGHDHIPAGIQCTRPEGDGDGRIHF
jgi:hypothetical protein